MHSTAETCPIHEFDLKVEGFSLQHVCGASLVSNLTGLTNMEETAKDENARSRKTLANLDSGYPVFGNGKTNRSYK